MREVRRRERGKARGRGGAAEGREHRETGQSDSSAGAGVGGGSGSGRGGALRALFGSIDAEGGADHPQDAGWDGRDGREGGEGGAGVGLRSSPRNSSLSLQTPSPLVPSSASSASQGLGSPVLAAGDWDSV